MKLTYGAQLPVSVDEAFDFLVEPANWALFFEKLESAEAFEGWQTVGGKARMANKALGKIFEMDLEMTAIDPPRSFRYTARTVGRPDLDNLRVFEPTDGGTRLTGTTEAEPRRGLAGISDRLLMLVVRRTYARGMAKLPGVIRAGSVGG